MVESTLRLVVGGTPDRAYKSPSSLGPVAQPRCSLSLSRLISPGVGHTIHICRWCCCSATYAMPCRFGDATVACKVQALTMRQIPRESRPLLVWANLCRAEQ